MKVVYVFAVLLALTVLSALAKAEDINSLFVVKVQQIDTDARELKYNSGPELYKATAKDPYYGYKIFILVDKSVSPKPGKRRNGYVRTPQTMYIYERQEDNSLSLAHVFPVSTGKEPRPGVSDTHEGFMRVQSAQATYVSRKYGEDMPLSLWFDTEYGTAIHQTLQSWCDRGIGYRASAGCIRLCPGDAGVVFSFVTNPQKYPRSSAIVLLDKKNGQPIVYGAQYKSIAPEGSFINQAPKIIHGYPVFVRVINGDTSEKVQEIEGIIQDPTSGFKKYFLPITDDAFSRFSI